MKQRLHRVIWSSVKEEEFIGDPRSLYASVPALQVSIEAMLDVFSHIVARLHWGVPTTDREMLETLLKKELISQDHFQIYAAMSKFHNRVVHGYIDVDARIIYKTMQNRFMDFDLFFSDVKRIIQNEQEEDKK